MKRTITTIILMILLATAVQATVNDAVLWYDMSTITGTTLQDISTSTNQHNATLTNAITGETCDWGNCIRFNHTAYATISQTNDAEIHPSGNWTFFARFRSTNITADTSALLGGHNGADWFTLGLQANNANAFVQMDDGTNPIPTFFYGVNLSNNTWHNYIVTKQNDVLKLYINGIYVNTGSFSGDDSVSTDGTALLVGAWPTPTQFWEGWIDELAIYNRTLTDGSCSANTTCGGEIAELEALTLSPYSDTTINLTAVSFYNSSTILTFNATINGTNYSTTTGNITVDMGTTVGTINITFWGATGHEDRTYENQAVNVKLQGALQPTSTSETFIVNAFHTNGSILTTANITVNGTNQPSSQWSDNLANWINATSPTARVWVTVQDINERYNISQGFHTINRTYNELNITMGANNLNITFWQHGSLTSTNGKVIRQETTSQTNHTNNFTATSILILNDNILQNARVYLHFNANIWGNYTQYYEYLNNYSRGNINLEVLNQADTFVWFQVVDESNSPIDEAVITIEEAYANGTWATFQTAGRRLTDHDGYTNFYFDSQTEYRITVTKDGYQPAVRIGTVGTMVQADKSEAFIYILTETDTSTDYNVFTFFPKYFSNRSDPIGGVILAKDYDLIQFNTSYRSALTTLTEDRLGRHIATLTPGTHFSTSTSDNITVHIYADNSLIHSKTLIYDTTTKTELFDFTSNRNIINPLLAIAIIILAGLIGTAIQGKGKQAFYGLTIFAALISTSYIAIAAIIIFHIILKTQHKVISE